MKKWLLVFALLPVAYVVYAKKDSWRKNCMNGSTEKIKMASGLEYIVLKACASGATAAKGNTVRVHYTGWLNVGGEPGKQFDSSVDRGQPFSFPLGAGYVIRGWDEGVAGMKVGEKRRLFIPASLGYGSRGAGAAIPPNADLIFDVELLAV
jgi:FKBP-type peptidyl-prolyl cis-trans isomerase